MNLINGHSGNTRNPAFNTPLGYTVNANVVQYGKDSSILKRATFVGMFPVDVAPIDLDWGTNDSIEEYSVTFAYQYWTSDSTDNV
jgi:hypothetical protein